MTSILTSAADGVGRIVLNRPDRMNAVTVDLGARLERALRELGARPDVAVILIRGAGGNFCAGGDFDEVQRLRQQGDLRPLFENFAAACSAIAEIDQPVVAAVEGVAMAGGFELIQAVDVALVRDDAKLADNHVSFGMLPGGGGSQRLPRLVGRARAMGHLLSGERLSGAEAVHWGLAFRSYPAQDFEAEVEAFMQRMTGRRRESLTGIKKLVRSGLEGSLAEGLSQELEAVLAHIAGEAGQASIQSFDRRGAAV